MAEFDLEALRATVLELLREKRIPQLRQLLNQQNPSDLAALLEDEDLEEEHLPVLFRILNKEVAAEAFVEMSSERQEMLIRAFSDAELKAVMDELYLDDAVDLVEEMPANVVQRILRNTTGEMRTQINELLKYPEDSAGSVMTVEYVSLRAGMTVREAFDRIRATGVDKETIYTCYVVKPDRTLVGAVSVRTLLLADMDATVDDLMEHNVISVRTDDDQELVAQQLAKYNFMSMPVVDREQRLVGIVTFDDAMDVIEEEATEDIEKMAALIPTDTPYLRSSAFEQWKKRIPWLLLLMISATFTSTIITHFETALSSAVVLTAFIPMLMDTSGNAGSQASVTIIRGLSLNEIQFSDVFRIVLKESVVAVLCGVTLAGANFLKLLYFDKVGVTVALVVCLTLLCAVFCAKIVGALLPLLAKKAGFDPAVMASPFITTIVDAISLLVYFRTAQLFLHI